MQPQIIAAINTPVRNAVISAVAIGSTPFLSSISVGVRGAYSLPQLMVSLSLVFFVEYFGYY